METAWLFYQKLWLLKFAILESYRRDPVVFLGVLVIVLALLAYHIWHRQKISN